MGAVSIQTCNWQLMDIADYEDKTQVKRLLRNYYNLENLAACGDQVAASIFIDLKTALHSDYVTPTQFVCILRHLIDHEPMDEVAYYLLRSKSSVAESVNRGVRNVMKALEGGRLFEQERTAQDGRRLFART